MASFSERRTLRRIPLLRDLSSRELEDAQERMVHRSYQAGEVIWRTHGPLRLSGYIQSGEIDLETRVDGVLIRTTRLRAGDPLPPVILRHRRSHDSMIARAVTDVRLRILPEPQRVQVPSAAKVSSRRGMNWLWPIVLLLLVTVLAREDMIRIASGLFYLASTQGEYAAPNDPRSMHLLEAAQKVEPGAVFAYNEQGYRWFQQKHVWDAAAAFDAAVARDPASAPALNNLAITYFTQGDLPQADRLLQQSVEQNPDNATARYNLGIILMQLHDSTGAIREFGEAGFIDPQAASPLLQQAYLYQQLGDYANAERRARSAVQSDPALVPAHLLLGMALYNQGREAEALAAFAETLVLEPGNRVATFYQALILGHQKQFDVALPILHSLLETSTQAGEAVRIRAEINALYRLMAEAPAGP